MLLAPLPVNLPLRSGDLISLAAAGNFIVLFHHPIERR